MSFLIKQKPSFLYKHKKKMKNLVSQSYACIRTLEQEKRWVKTDSIAYECVVCVSVGDPECDPCIAVGQHLFGQAACRDYQQHSAETARHQSTQTTNARTCVQYVGFNAPQKFYNMYVLPP